MNTWELFGMLEFLAGVCIASSHHVHAYCLLYVLRVFTCVSKTDICALQGKADFNTYVLFGTFIYVLLSAFTFVYVACFYLCFCDWHLCVAGKTGSGGVCTVWSHLVHTACHEGDSPPGVPHLLLHSGMGRAVTSWPFIFLPHWFAQTCTVEDS